MPKAFLMALLLPATLAATCEWGVENCPDNYLSDGMCDETYGLCPAGTDTEDCGGRRALETSQSDLAFINLLKFGNSLHRPTEYQRRQLAEYSSTNTQCALSNTYIGSCSGLEKKTGCWADGTFFGIGTCCAASDGDCCELNIGLIVGIAVGVVVFLVLLIVCCMFAPCCACCPCNKAKKKAVGAASA